MSRHTAQSRTGFFHCRSSLLHQNVFSMKCQSRALCFWNVQFYWHIENHIVDQVKLLTAFCFSSIFVLSMEIIMLSAGSWIDPITIHVAGMQNLRISTVSDAHCAIEIIWVPCFSFLFVRCPLKSLQNLCNLMQCLFACSHSRSWSIETCEHDPTYHISARDFRWDFTMKAKVLNCRFPA